MEDGSLAEDIGQDVFLRIYKNLGSYKEDMGTPFSAWLYITARNVAISEMRKRNRQFLSREADEHDSGLSVEQQLIHKEELETLRNSLTQLPEPYKTTLIESLQGSSMQEIANLESISTGTVKSRIHRAKKLLAGLMKNHLQGN